MKRKIALLNFCVSLIFIPQLVFSLEFQPLGFESLSMGGAGVASTRGSFAVYYNPALLAESAEDTEISFSAGAGIREVNLANHIDTLADIDIEETINNIAANAPFGPNSSTDRANVTTIKNELGSIAQKNGLQLIPTVSLGMRIGTFGFGVYGLGEGTAFAVIDPNYLDIIVEYSGFYAEYNEITDTYSLVTQAEYEQRSLEYALDNDLTYLQLSGLTYVEIPFGYAHSLETLFGTFNLGGSIKVMTGKTFDGKIKIDTESGDVQDNLDDADKSETTWGMDMGLIYKPNISELRFGIVGKNLNTPEFDTVEGRTYNVKPQVRAGAAYQLSNFSFALDIDLTKNETFITNFDAQYIGGGVNYQPASWFCIRAGIMQNIAESNEGTIFTAGLGFGLKWFQLDVAAQVSSKKGHFEDTDIPRYARGQISMVSKW